MKMRDLTNEQVRGLLSSVRILKRGFFTVGHGGRHVILRHGKANDSRPVAWGIDADNLCGEEVVLLVCKMPKQYRS